jgi:hypothetical protein
LLFVQLVLSFVGLDEQGVTTHIMGIEMASLSIQIHHAKRRDQHDISRWF